MTPTARRFIATAENQQVNRWKNGLLTGAGQFEYDAQARGGDFNKILIMAYLY